MESKEKKTIIKSETKTDRTTPSAVMVHVYVVHLADPLCVHVDALVVPTLWLPAPPAEVPLFSQCMTLGQCLLQAQLWGLRKPIQIKGNTCKTSHFVIHKPCSTSGSDLKPLRYFQKRVWVRLAVTELCRSSQPYGTKLHLQKEGLIELVKLMDCTVILAHIWNSLQCFGKNTLHCWNFNGKWTTLIHLLDAQSALH